MSIANESKLTLKKLMMLLKRILFKQLMTQQGTLVIEAGSLYLAWLEL